MTFRCYPIQRPGVKFIHTSLYQAFVKYAFIRPYNLQDIFLGTGIPSGEQNNYCSLYICLHVFVYLSTIPWDLLNML